MDTATLRRIYVYDIQQTDTRVKGTESSAQTNERNTPTTECTQRTAHTQTIACQTLARDSYIVFISTLFCLIIDKLLRQHQQNSLILQ